MFWGQEGRIGPQGLGCSPVVGLGIQEKTLGKALQGAQGGTHQSPCPSLCRCAGDLHPFHCGEYWIKREQGGDPSDLPPSCIPGLPGSLAQGAPNPEVLQGGDNQSHSEHPWPLGVLQGSPPEPGPGLRGPSAVEFYETPLQSLYGECNPP
ncbi:Hypothetical predicted protein [Podarcis lilfordi]|uniref:Uncharacterized protein n=1 Tax=Podarcis lilfordi TaxID=74358 RepID=A0AA35P182_9SAUR|nr:Hypothetical predicted protein [Podarcis lilfordi]